MKETYEFIEENIKEYKRLSPRGDLYAWTYESLEGNRYNSDICDASIHNPEEFKKSFINSVLNKL